MKKITNFYLIALAISVILLTILIFFGKEINLFNNVLNKRTFLLSGSIGGTSAFYTWKNFLEYLFSIMAICFFTLTLINLYLTAVSEKEKLTNNHSKQL